MRIVPSSMAGGQGTQMATKAGAKAQATSHTTRLNARSSLRREEKKIAQFSALASKMHLG